MKLKDIASFAGSMLLMAAVVFGIYALKNSDAFKDKMQTGEPAAVSETESETEADGNREESAEAEAGTEVSMKTVLKTAWESAGEMGGWIAEAFGEKFVGLSGQITLEAGVLDSPDEGDNGAASTEDMQEDGRTASSYLQEAESLAAGYFYAEAVSLLEAAIAHYPEDGNLREAKEKYQMAQSELAAYAGVVAHISMQSLIVDPDKAFDGDEMADAYEKTAVTVTEFRNILEEMYAKGYILIDIHDLMSMSEDSSGDVVYSPEKPMVPEGKIPFILSVDDVNYYAYTEQDGFADRLVLDAGGSVKCIYNNGGTETVGDYDVIPILDAFVAEHPDFSYRGAKGIIALTGFEGVFGYATNKTDSGTYSQDAATVSNIAARLLKTGWMFASHGYWHQNTADISMETLELDNARWEAEVGSLVGTTEIYVYPDGKEVEYPGEKLDYLKSEGYSIFCGIDEKNILSIGTDYIRQTRILLNGTGLTAKNSRLAEFFSLKDVIDPKRPD